MAFYKLKVPRFTQYKYAWAEPKDAKYSDDYPKCPKCGRAIGGRYWLPPFNIIIKQPRNIGDFVNGIMGTDLYVSEKFKKEYEQSGLTGIDQFIELNVVQMGAKKNTRYPIPKLFGATIAFSKTQVDYDKMDVTWFFEPKKNICDLCCPGGGGDGGGYQTYNRIVFKEETLTDSDFFIPINFSGNIIVSEKTKNFIEKHNFTNVKLTPVFEAKHDIFNMNI